MTAQPHLCLARDFYVQTAGLAAFNTPAGVVRRGNGRSTTYVFADGSKFVVGVSGYHRYVGLDGWTYAERASSAVAHG